MKKNREVINNEKEDLEIRKVAYFKNSQQILLLVILIVLFTLTFFCSLFYISKYYDAKINLGNGSKILEVTTKDYYMVINNKGVIDKTINNADVEYNDKITIEKVNKLTFTAKKASNVTFNIRYNIINNDFERNAIANLNNDVLVRFMYSYDNENWEYVNNAISTTESTLKPLMGSYYDISGLVTKLKVVTNYNLENKTGKDVQMYWKCETLFNNIKDNVGKNLKAEFKIDVGE